jgi:hypothetical protein
MFPIQDGVCDIHPGGSKAEQGSVGRQLYLQLVTVVEDIGERAD